MIIHYACSGTAHGKPAPDLNEGYMIGVAPLEERRAELSQPFCLVGGWGVVVIDGTYFVARSFLWKGKTI